MEKVRSIWQYHPENVSFISQKLIEKYYFKVLFGSISGSVESFIVTL